jgi:hypothetical protein
VTTTLEQLRAGQLAGVRELKLACGLKQLPREVFDLADTLEVLDLSNNALSTLPDDLPRLRKLRILFASNNAFTALPEVLGDCTQLSMIGFKANRISEVPAAALPPALRWLILTDNEIGHLPAELGRCMQLQKLMLAGNRLRALPEELAACSRLELLRLAANRFAALPRWLLRLPRLAWLAYAGNPFGAALEDAALSDTPIRAIRWDRLTLEQPLGEGASGVIYRATLRDDRDGGRQRQRAVAVKLFKGAVTSDGLPDCEMAACIRAGDEASLIPVLGKVIDHPAATHGLVMELIDPRFGNLAGPPSLASCTRDVYRDGLRFDLGAVVGIASGIANVGSHLHRRGIMHGDLYAHNILHDGAGHALLGDFGAASFYDASDRDLGVALQRLEVRAYGCLLEELIERCDALDAQPQIAAELVALRTRCLSEAIDSRPLFDEIAASLSVLKEQ